MSTSSKSSSRPSSKKGLLYLLFGVGTLFLIIALVSVKPLGRAYKNSRAKGIVTEANSLLRQGKLAESFEKARKAYDFAPKNPGVMRLMGNLMKDNPESRDSASYFFSQLKDTGEATIEDEVALASIHLVSGNQTLCREIVDNLMEKAPENPKLLTLLARLNRLSGSGADSLSATNNRIRKAVESSTTTNPDEKLELAKAQLLSSSKPLQKSGIDLLWEIVEGEDEASLESLRLLATSSAISLTQAEELTERLRNHPMSDERHRLIASSLQLKIEPSEREEIIATEVRKRLGQPVSELGDFLGWLLQENESSWILDLLPIETAKKHPTALGYTLEALARENRWADLKELVSSEDIMISESRRSLFLANSALNLNEPEQDVRRLIGQTINKAGGSGDQHTVASATQLAESAGYDELTRLGLSVLATSEVWKERALMGYYGLAAQGNNSTEMLDSATAVLKESPQNERFQAISTYLHLLHGTNLEIASARSRELTASNRSPDRMALLAFSKFRTGDLEGASAIYDQLDPIDLTPGQRAVYSWISFTTGDTRPAIEVAQKIPTPLLNDAERVLVDRILGQN